uniref:Cytochrome P450 6k1 n=1 Tax=Blattella germanica TaxID=6973 RepID=CP6K1_BLAGE|nr:RecName: Full=Cytochrome P450 6k1; AltName: Full=CYPVIK1 [Blattella germanica]AAK57914.1 cytochrome P450 CYP6K1 [Blattella germanica]
MVTITGCALCDALVILATLIVAAYLYYAVRFTYWKRKGVVNPKPLPVFGNFLPSVLQKRSPGQILWDIYKAAEAPFVGFYIFARPAILIKDPNIIKHVLVKDFNAFSDRHASAAESDTLGSQNLFTLNGAPWKYLRVKLSPTFTSGRMKKMYPLVESCAKQLQDYLKENCNTKAIEVKETTAKYATDVISTCAFGIESNSLKDPNAEFREFGRKIFEFTRYRTFEVMALFFSPGLVKFLNGNFFTKETTEFLRKVFWDTINFRESNKISRDDFMDLLIQLKNKGTIDNEDGEVTEKVDKIDKDSHLFEFTGDNLVSQPALFFTAGFETNATTLSFTLYELSLQPDLQNRLRSEIAGVMKTSNGKPTYEDVFGMPYLHMVVSETLRKYPPLPLLDRVCLQDYKVPGTDLIIERDTPVFIALLGLHRDPQYYPNPERYDPERFSEENKRQRKAYTYLPFGEGPHNCIGLRFGYMAVKTALVHMLAEFEVKPCKDTPIPLELSTRSSVLATTSGIPLTFVKSTAQVS